jgi:hypothetical protein
VTYYLENILAPREKVVLTLRQHWFLALQESLVALIVMMAIFALQAIIRYVQPDWPVWIGYVLMLLPLFSIIRAILRSRNIRIALTNRRVLKLSGVLEKHIGEISLGMIDGIEIAQGGIEELLGFGDIIFSFRETEETVTFYKITDPITFKDSLDSLLQIKENKARSKTPQETDIPRVLKDLSQLYKNGLITEEEYRRRKNNLLKNL